MDIDLYFATYPVKSVNVEPIPIDDQAIYINRVDAESYQEWVEITENCGGLEILEFNNKYYVCWRKNE